MDEAIAQVEVARRLAISAKQVRRLTKQKGMPRLDNGKYPWPEAADWYRSFKKDEGLRRRGYDKDADADQELALKRRVEREIKELELAERRGELVPHHVHLELLSDVASSLRSVILSSVGRRAGEKAAAENPEEIREIEEEEARELLEQLQRISAPSENGDGRED